MILAQVRDEMNQVNHLLDEYESIHGRFRGRERRNQLLEMALRASIRGLEALQEDQRTRPRPATFQDHHQVLEEMRQDAALLRAFIEAECRLLEDLGVTATAVRRLRQGLAETLLELDQEGHSGPDQAAELDDLLYVLRQDLVALQISGKHAAAVGRLVGVIEALGGGLIAATNGVVGAGLTPVTGGLSAGGAAVSVVAGTEMFARGVRKALD